MVRAAAKLCIDDILAATSPVFSAPSAALILAASFYRSRQILGPSHHIWDHILNNKALRIFLALVATRTVNHALTRLVRNHGWKADPPKWSRIKGKGDIVLITGGSTGIGKELLERLAKKTPNIINLDLAEPTYKCAGVRHFKCDVTNAEQIAEIAATIRKEIGNPTIIVNNAGIARGNTILNTEPEQFLLTYKVNVLGCHNILREFLPHIIKINHGHIMTTASSASYASIPQLSEYSCSKSAALALHETLNGELRHRYNAPRVRTSVICPTKVSTQMGDAMKDTDNQFLTPTLTAEYMAVNMERIIDSGLSDHFIAPTFAKISLPLLRSAPEWFRWLINTVGKTHGIITDAGNEKQNKVYTLVNQLDESHGLTKMKQRVLGNSE